MARLGVLGGSFDPIHLGHVRCGQAVRKAERLDSVLFIPAHVPPHKRKRRLTDAALRLEMVRRALADEPGLEPCDLEIRREGVSYTVETLETLARERPDDCLCLILGMDAFRDLESWKDVDRIFELADVIVMTRPGEDMPLPPLAALPVAARKAFCYQEDTHTFRNESGHVLRFLAVPAIDISSSMIREARARSRSIRRWVSPAVARLIEEKHLYAPEEAGA